MFFIGWQSKGESKMIYAPGVDSEAELTKDGLTVTTYGREGKLYQRYNFTPEEAETLTMEYRA